MLKLPKEGFHQDLVGYPATESDPAPIDFNQDWTMASWVQNQENCTGMDPELSQPAMDTRSTEDPHYPNPRLMIDCCERHHLKMRTNFNFKSIG